MGHNQPMYVAQLRGYMTVTDGHDKLKELTDLAVSAVLQMEQLKELVHQLAGAKSGDVRVIATLRNTTRLISEMRHGPL